MSKFALDIARFAQKFEATYITVVRKVASDMFAGCILKTPADTGRARANWSCTVGSAFTGTVESTDISGSATIQKMNSVVNGWNARGSIFLTNNVKYIGVLEYGLYPNPPKNGTGKTAGGFSIQAPNGMARLSREEAMTHIQSVI